jgi:hypothetical protein
MRNLFLLLATMTLIISCEDKLVEPETKYINQSSICPVTSPESEPSHIDFSGIDRISQISKTSAVIHWKHIEGVHLYNIIRVSNLERKIVGTVIVDPLNQTSSNYYEEKTLSPDTEYKYLVRATDRKGFSDTNTNYSIFKTLPWPNFTNQKSIELNGSQNITLVASDKYKLKDNFTISLWFKTTHKNTEKSATRLITFHAGNNNSQTALSLALKNETIQLKYIDQNLKPRTKSYKTDYYNNQWHHLVLSATKNILRVYLNKNKILQQKVKVVQFGSHPASIGSRSGIWNGFVGRIDEVAIYNTFFNPTEIESLYNDGKAIDHKLEPKPKSLIHWYQMGDQVNDGPNFIEDVVGGFSGTTVDDQFMFVNDTP